MKPKILAFAGSTRKDSYNKKLVRAAAEGARTAGAEVTLIDLKDFPLPLYDGDLEAEKGMPENGKKLRKLFKEHQGLLIASPEYNSSMTGVFKNTIDWVSRDETGEGDLSGFEGKAAGLLSASPGALGGSRALVHVRAMLGNIRVLVIPEQFSLSKASDAFHEDGTMKDPKQKASAEKIGAALAAILAKLH